MEDAGADDVAEGGLGAFDEGLADVADAEGGFVGGGDVVVDYGGELEVDVVFGHADLSGDLCCRGGGLLGFWWGGGGFEGWIEEMGKEGKTYRRSGS